MPDHGYNGPCRGYRIESGQQLPCHCSEARTYSLRLTYTELSGVAMPNQDDVIQIRWTDSGDDGARFRVLNQPERNLAGAFTIDVEPVH